MFETYRIGDFEFKEEHNKEYGECVKIWTWGRKIDSNVNWTRIDHSPYSPLTVNEYEMLVKFYEKHNRFPDRSDIGCNRALDPFDLVVLTADL